MTEYGYDENSQPTSVVTNGNESLYEYDAMGNVSSVTDAEGRCVKLAYDLNGNLTEIIYPDGTKDVNEYDALGRVVQSTPRTGLATAYAYDESGNIVRMTQGEQTTAYEYDLLGRMVRQIAADGTETAYAYDALGNLVGQTDELGNQTTFSYTAESLLEQVTYANGASQSLSYDLAGNITGETDAEGNAKQYQYDKANRLIAVVDELGGKTSYAYDAMDHIVQVTDALRHATKYTYDKDGNLTSETDALGNRVQYAYTPEGWLSSVTKADGAVMTFEYDKTGALTRQNVGDGQSVTSSYNEIGKLTEVSSEAGTIRYQYNEQGFLISVENVNGDVVSYTYDAYGNKTSMTYPDSRTVSYTYDAMNRMVGVVGLDGETTSYVYDAAGRRIQTVSGNMTTGYAYDSVGNLTEQATSGTSDIAFRYSYDRNGYITGEKRTENGTETENSYAYNALGELTSFLQSTGYGESYAYDKAGNMLEKAITGTDGQNVTLKMAYNAANQLTGMTNGQSKLAYSYDKNGSLIQKTLTSKTYGKLTDRYAYDTLDQLTAYVGYDGYQQQFTYDANGMRLSKKETGDASRSTLEELLRGNIAGLPEIVAMKVQDDAADVPEELAWATTDYLYDITQEYYQVISETRTETNGHTATTAYAYGLERIAAYTADGKTGYVYDGRGSVAQAVTAPVAGEKVSAALPDVAVKVQSFSYTAFGEQMGAQKVSGFAYNAEAYDAATGMINLRARQYEPTIGRFEQRDIMRGSKYVPMSLQPYLYTKNNAIMYYDPSGMEEVTILSITRIAEEALEYSNRTDVNDDGKIKKLSEAYSQIAGMIRQDEYIPADLMRMLQEAERALKNVKGKSPQVDYEKYQIHIDACELAMTMIDNGFDEEDAIGRLYMDQHFTRNNEQVDWSTTKFSPGEANENELISPYTMVASAKYMYDMEWKYDPNNEMRPGSVVCDSYLRVIAKLHFSNSGYKYHEKKWKFEINT